MTAQRFIELEYTGTVDGIVFDTTRKHDAPAGTSGPFGPMVVMLGSGQLIPGLDAFLQDKKPGKYTLTLDPENAFGKKDAKLLKLVPLTSFGKKAKELEPGLPVTIGNAQGTVKSVSGGRVVIDFNHPLAGKAVSYDLEYVGDVGAPDRKVRALLKAMLGAELPVENVGADVQISLPKGFPSEGLIKEVEKHTGVTVTVKEVELPKHEHSHDHDDSHHGHNH